MEQLFKTITDEIRQFISGPHAFRSILVLVISVIAAFWLSKIAAHVIIRVAQYIAVRSDNATSEERKVQLRRVETYLSVAVAVIRALIVGLVAAYTWQLFSASTSSTTAAIGAGTFFVVIAGATIGMLLRDITNGATMIIEQWFSVGEYVKFEPFGDVAGVVERMNLRSTKLRGLNGEVIWVHNQHIQGVHVTPTGIRTIAVDVFANNERVAGGLIEKVIDTMPRGTLKLIEKPRISREEEWGTKLWYFTIIGKVAPGREWLMDKYFIESLVELDERRKGPKTFVRPPISRYADERAEKSFKRAVQMSRKDPS